MCSETILKLSSMAATHTEMSLNTPITWKSVECHREHTHYNLPQVGERNWSQDISLGIATDLRAGWPSNLG
jgi:hypothetical protein